MSKEHLGPPENEGSRKVKWVLNRVEQNLVAPANIDFPEKSREIFLEKIEDSNVIPFVYFNHYDLGNGIPMAILAQNFMDLANKARGPEFPFSGFLMPISATLPNGKQGAFMQEALSPANAELFLKKYHVTPVECITKNDRIKRNAEGTNIKLMLHIARMTRDRNGGIVMFPETSVEGGRRIKEGPYKGHRNGLQEFYNNMNEIIDLVRNTFGRELLDIPVGLWGPNILHTDSRLPTLTCLHTLASKKNPKTLINAKVGEIMLHSDMIKEIAAAKNGGNVTEEDISKHMRGMVARLLPPDFLPPTERR